jgi:hypothetical protein
MIKVTTKGGPAPRNPDGTLGEKPADTVRYVKSAHEATPTETLVNTLVYVNGQLSRAPHMPAHLVEQRAALIAELEKRRK